MLTKVRPELSFPSQYVIADRSYLRAIARQEFIEPISVNEYSRDTRLRGHGTVQVLTRLELVPNSQAGQLRVSVDGQGFVSTVACRRRAVIRAYTQLCLAATEDVFLAPHQVSGAAPENRVRLDSQVRGVSVRGSHGGHLGLVSRVVARIAQRMLPQADWDAARKAERDATERVEDVVYDIGYRVNGLFKGVYWDRLAAREIIPQLAIRSTHRQLIWTADYARPWQLAAPGPPPMSMPAGTDLQTYLHASALNNRALVLGGARLDEAKLDSILDEDLKLRVPRLIEGEPRESASLRFAALSTERRSVNVTFDDGLVHFQLLLDEIRWGHPRM